MKLVLVLIFALISGCSSAQYKEAFQDIKQEYQANPEVQVLLSCAKVLDRGQGWATTVSPCTPGAESSGRAFYTANLEYGEDGSRLSSKQPEAITKWLETTAGPKVIVAYVHGWNHNAADSSGNYAAFPILAAKIADNVQRIYSNNNYKSYPKVLGVYLGWPGKSSDSIFSIYSRSRVADRVAEAGHLASDLKLIQAVNSKFADSALGGSMLLIGHSLGGRLLHKAFLPALEQENSRPLGPRTMVVTAEAAITADYFHGLMQKGLSATKLPHWLNVGSRDDKAAIFPTGLAAALGFLPTKNYFSSGSFTTIQNYQAYSTNYISVSRDFACKKTEDSDVCKFYKNNRDGKLIYPSSVMRSLAVGESSTVDLFFSFQNFIYSANGVKPEVDISDGHLYKLRISSKGSSPLGGRFWNTTTDNSIIYSKDEKRENPDHNGYLSTILSRLMVENLWLLNRED